VRRDIGGFCVASEGDHGRVFQQEQDIADLSGFAQVDELLLQAEAFGVADGSELTTEIKASNSIGELTAPAGEGAWATWGAAQNLSCALQVFFLLPPCAIRSLWYNKSSRGQVSVCLSCLLNPAAVFGIKFSKPPIDPLPGSHSGTKFPEGFPRRAEPPSDL